MLADTEWKTPHTSPAGMTVAEWVESVRRLERTGWLKDPETAALPEDPEHPATKGQDLRSRLCYDLCWRPRCHRAKRCRHLIPLAVREFQPEFGIRLAELRGGTPEWTGPHDPEKLAILRERIR